MISKGIISPVLTPFKEDQHIDIQALKLLIDNLINGHVHGLFIAGTAGFGSMLTFRQYQQLVLEAVAHVNKRLPVLAGILEPSTNRCIERIEFLETTGVTAAVLVAPYYLKAQKDVQLLRHFEKIRDATSLELVIYNLPSCTGTQIPLGVIEKMTDYKWITACKDSSGDDDYFSALCRYGAESGLNVYQGMHPDFSKLAELNAAGCVPVPANVYPDLFVKAWNKRNDLTELAAIQRECDAVWNQLVAEYDFFSRTVELMADQGIGSGVMPEPFSISDK